MRLPEEGAAWALVCPYCSVGYSVSTGLEAERIIRSHDCPQSDAA